MESKAKMEVTKFHILPNWMNSMVLVEMKATTTRNLFDWMHSMLVAETKADQSRAMNAAKKTNVTSLRTTLVVEKVLVLVSLRTIRKNGKECESSMSH